MRRFNQRCKILFGFTTCLAIIQLYSGYNFIINFGKIQDDSEERFRHSSDLSRNQVDSRNISAAGLEINRTGLCSILASADANSALRRAKSNICQQEIRAVACIQESGRLYDSSLPRTCPLKGNSTVSYLGCFKDQKDDPDLNGLLINLESVNTPKDCIRNCFVSGFNYAGVQNGNQCWCGESYGKYGLASDEASCYLPCSGNVSMVCGSFDAQNIYSTGFGAKIQNIAVSATSPQVLDTEHSSSVRILFMLTLSGRALRQVKRLLKAIYHVNHYYFIHVDSRQEYLHRELTQLSVSFANIRVVQEDRMATIWGGASLLQMLLRCMEQALSMADWHWDFFLNLSESDFPLKRTEDLTAFLTANRKYNFLKSHGPNTPRFIKKQGLDRTFHECDFRMWRLGDRALPDGIRIDGGSDWTCLNREFVQYVVLSSDDLITGLKQYFRYTLLPAETFFHTALQNSVYCTTHVDNNLHKTNWNRQKGCQCQYKHIVDWCGCSPSTFVARDFQMLKETENRPIYFARKFEAVISTQIINLVDNWIHGTPAQEIPAHTSYWQNEFHFSDSVHAGDDTPYTFFRSFARNSAADLIRNSASSQKCHFMVTGVSAAHLFYQADALSGLLVTFNVSRQGSRVGGHVQIETYMKPARSFRILEQENVASRLRRLEVGSAYDLKEQVFRNYASLLGPHSELVLVHWWAGGSGIAEMELSVSVALFDPLNRLAYAATAAIPAGKQFVGVHSASLPMPLLPGLWRAVMTSEGRAIAQSDFLVAPYSHLGRRPITAEEAMFINGGSQDGYNVTTQHLEELGHLASQWNESAAAAALMEVSLNSRKSGGTLFAWIDELTRQFWTLQSLCLVSLTQQESCDILPECSATHWSTKASDPKSALDLVDYRTGRLVHRHE